MPSIVSSIHADLQHRSMYRSLFLQVPTDPCHSILLDQQLLNLKFHGIDGLLELRGLIGGDGAGNDGPTDAAGTAEGHFAGHKDVGDILVFAQERQMQENFNGFRVSRHDDHFADPSIQGFGGLVGTLFGLFVVGGLLN